MPVDGVHHIDQLAIRAGYTYIAPLMLTGENTSTKELINFTAPFFILGGAVKINSQRLEDTQVGYTSQKYTLDKHITSATLRITSATLRITSQSCT